MSPICPICGASTFRKDRVLWPALINEWQLSPSEAAYIDRQQGERCTTCGSNLRSIALARALQTALRADQPLRHFIFDGKCAARILEINEAGNLHPHLAQISGHVFGAYPQLDMHALPYADESFDIVVHSDTLEHVPNPLHALSECRRVLKRAGALCFTVPIIVGRMTRSREGLPKSYHGSAQQSDDDWAVHTEFGADAWAYPIQAGFSEVSLFAVEFPAAVAILARKD